MALISLRQLLDHAAEHCYGVPAFNINNLEQVQAIMRAADACDSPVIMQASAGARKYAGEGFLLKLVGAAVESYPHIPVVLHQDHGASPAICLHAIKTGFSSVMMDGSLLEDAKTPSSYEYNVEVTWQVVQAAHAAGVSVEGELGVLGSLESGLASRRWRPCEAASGWQGRPYWQALLPGGKSAVAVGQSNSVGSQSLLARNQSTVFPMPVAISTCGCQPRQARAFSMTAAVSTMSAL